MSSKLYTQINFTKLDGGMGQKFFEKIKPHKIYDCKGIRPNRETKKLQLSENFVELFEEDNYYCLGENSFGTNMVHLPSGKILHLVINNTTSKVCILEQDTPVDNTPTEIHAFAENSDRNYLLIYYREKVLIFYRFNGKVYFAYSINNGDTMVSDAELAHGIPFGYHLAVDGVLYVYTDEKIIYTEDGISWTIYHDLADPDDSYTGFTELDGVKYAIISNERDQSKFVEFNHDDEPICLRELNNRLYGNLAAFNNKIYIAVYVARYIIFYVWDKANLKYIGNFYAGSSVAYKFLVHDNEFLYFYTHDKFLRINKNNGIFSMPDPVHDFVGIYKIDGSLAITTNTFSTKKYQMQVYSSIVNPVAATGYFTTPYVRERQKPCYLIIKNKPLAADCSIVITADTDMTEAYATAVQTINTDGVSRTVIDLKSLISKVDQISFKITLADSSYDSNVEDLDIIYLYQALGLENAK